MKTKMALWNRLPLLAAVCLCCAPQLRAQTAPVITTQPASQTNLAGTAATFTVAVSGAGPFTYQWQFNGSNLPNNIITTVAGNGYPAYSWDGIEATCSSLYSPSGVAFDGAGNMYIADTSNNRIRKVDTNGFITTFAGSHFTFYYGDGGQATNAGLHNPHSVAVDAIGNLYIADTSNNRIRKVSTNGIITTVAGGGAGGDGGAATQASLNSPYGVDLDSIGNLYIADLNNNRVRKVGANGIINTVAGTNSAGFSGDGSAAVNAQLSAPSCVAFDAFGNLYIADTYNNRIRKVDTNGVITTIAGGGTSGLGDGGAAVNASLSNPHGVAVDALGDLLIADYGNNRIRTVDATGVITTLAGNGSSTYNGNALPPASTSLKAPIGVTLDAVGNVYIADSGNNWVRKLWAYAGYPTLLLNNVNVTNVGSYTVIISNSYGSVTSAVAILTVEAPPIITFQPCSQLVATGGNATLNATAAGAPPLCYFWYDDATNLLQSGMDTMFAIQDFSTNDAGSYTVVVTNAYGSVTSQVATLMAPYPPSVTTPPSSQTVLGGANVSFTVAVTGSSPFTYQWQFNGTNLPNNIITTAAGTNVYGLSGDGGAAVNAALKNPYGVALDSFGNLYIADCQNYCIRKVDTNGVITTVAGTHSQGYSGDGGLATNAMLSLPVGVTLDASGNLYIADYTNGFIRKVSTNGVITTVAGNAGAYYAEGGLAVNSAVVDPSGVTADAFGNLYIAQDFGWHIRIVGVNGIITTAAGSFPGFSGDGGPATNADLQRPAGVALDASGNLYIADQWNNRVRKVGTTGTISTVAGNGAAAFGGDGGAATNANLYRPSGVVLDASGNLYITDQWNNRVRKVDTNGIITTVAGNGIGNFSGDGGAAAGAELNMPFGEALDAIGNLYIADSGNNRIREIHFAGLPSLALTNVSATNAGSYSVVVTSPYGCVTSPVAALTVQAPPVITIQPTNQTVLAGSSPSFSVVAAGSGPFGYSWFLAGTNLVQSDTNSTLTVPCVFTNNAGSYTVVVTNAWGSVTSAVAALTVTIPSNPPQIMTGDDCFGFVTNQFGFNLSVAFGQTIVVDGSSNLVNWMPLVTNTVGGATPFYFSDPYWTNYPARFYRARLP